LGQSTLIERALAPLRGAVLWSVTFSLGINLLMLTVPLYLLQLFDRVLSSRSMDTLWVLTVIAVVALVTYGLLETVRKLMLTRTGYLLDARLGPDVLQTLLHSPSSSGEYHSVRQLRDLTTLRNYLAGNGLQPWLDAPWSTIFIAVIFMLHPVLGWLSLASFVLLFLLALLNEALTREKLQKANEQTAVGSEMADAAVTNREAVVAMGMAGSLIKRWEQHHSGGLGDWEDGSRKLSTLTSLSKVLRFLLQISILGTGAVLVINAELTAGGMIAASILVSRALAPVEQLIGSWSSTLSARKAYRSVTDLLEAQELPNEGMPLPEPAGKVQVEGMSYVHPGQQDPILKSLSFTIQPGESLGLIGPTGSGKTTLARLLLGVFTPRLGNVRLDGLNISEWDPEDRGQYIGYLPQDLELFSGTVAQNIARFTEAKAEDIIAAAQLSGAHEMIMQLPQGYETRVGEAGNALSGGQRQRIALARALFGPVRFVVLDEPNANQDRLGETALLQAMQKLKERKVTTIIIAHRPAVVQTVDKLMVLRDGRVATFGPRDEVLASLGATPETAEGSK
jgi:ATP-binding cassette, subfamily C, type I secretion system permease/ATPase